MHYHEVALLSSPLGTLTYQSDSKIETGTIVQVMLRAKMHKAVILTCADKPEFETQDIVEISEYYYAPKQIELAHFISKYYFSSLGEALALMVAFHHDDLYKDATSTRYTDSKIILSTKQEEALAFLQEHQVSLLF